MNSCCLKRLYKSHVIELIFWEKQTEPELGWPHYIDFDYLVLERKESSIRGSCTTYYFLKNYLSTARQKISVLLKLSTISRWNSNIVIGKMKSYDVDSDDNEDEET